METVFTQLISSSNGIIHAVLNKYCKDIQEQDDLRQEILKEAWLNYPKFRQECSFSSWIYQIGRNTAIDRIRRLRTRIHTVALHNIFYDIADNPPEEQCNDISWNLLTALEKELLILWAEGESYKSISSKLNIDENTLRVRIHRIKNRLQNKTPITVSKMWFGRKTISPKKSG